MKKFVFAGNRFYVLEKMLELKLNPIKIFAHKDSYLEKELIKRNIDYSLIQNKADFLKTISKLDFDYFISNGLAYILPISALKKEHQKFINIHPSLLPDLKGKNPVNGALLYKRNTGATCHYMDDGVDTGDIISQAEIEYSEELDASLLYQLAFKLEAKAFLLAYERNFKPAIRQSGGDYIYYSQKDEDRIIDIKNDSIDLIKRKVSAYSSLHKGVFLDGKNVIRVDVIENENLIKLIDEFKISAYENYILIKKDGKILKFMLNPLLQN